MHGSSQDDFHAGGSCASPDDSPCSNQRTEKSQTRVHVVTACRNSERTISDTIESVLEQAQYLGHYMIVDGVSTDGTLEVLNRYLPAFAGKLRIVSETDKGIYDAMNKGIRLCLKDARDMDLIATLNSDDRYERDALKTIIAASDRYPHADVLFGDVALLDEAGRPTGKRRRSAPNLTLDTFSEGMPVEHPAMFVRAHIYREHGLYDESFPIAADYDFALRLVEAGVRTQHVGAVLTGFRVGGVSTTAEDRSLRDAMRVRIAHGANAASEWSRYYKRRAFARVFSFVSWIPGLSSLQSRYGSSARAKSRRED